MLTATEIAQLLERYLPSAEAERRAVAMAADLSAVGFDLVASTAVSDAHWQALGARPQAEYVLPASPFSIDAANGNQAMDGSGLTRGNLLRLSQAVDLGRRWLPGTWPHAFRHELNGPGHLDVVTELWWLKHWRGLASVQRGPKPHPSAPDADWLLQIQDALARCAINLEVKRRTSNLNAWFKHGTATVSLRDVSRKFLPGSGDTANVVALTVFQRPDAGTIRHVRDWLEQQPAVDAVLVWIEANAGGEPLVALVKAGKPWIGFLLKEPDAEDLMVAGLTRGTLCQPDEVPAFLDRFVDGLRRSGQ